jgi:hypothetical protein
VEAVSREPFSTVNSQLTGKNTGKIRQNAFVEPPWQPKAQSFRAF